MEKTQQMTVRPGRAADIARIVEIYAAARRYMRANGNFAQWSDSYPSAASARADIAEGWCHLVEAGGHVVGTFCLMTAPEPTYTALEDAEDVPYVTIHRIASDGSVRGIFAAAMRYVLGRYGCDVRIDTHADNRRMLDAIRRQGFSYAGEITLADGSPRLAFRLRPRGARL